MDLHQLQVTYRADEDRVLLRASFKTEDGGLQELRAWLTRRLISNLWPAIVDALERQVALNKPQAAHARADIVGMEHHASVEHIRDSGSFDNPFDNGVDSYPLGETPILVTAASFTLNPDQPIRIDFAPANGKGFEIAFPPVVLHGLCSLLKDAVSAADWDMELEMPGATARPAGMLN
jgi:hypothetical protein